MVCRRTVLVARKERRKLNGEENRIRRLLTWRPGSSSYFISLFHKLYTLNICIKGHYAHISATCYTVSNGPGSSVGIATELRVGRSGIESRWGRDFPPVQTGPGAHPASCKMGTGSFPGVKCGRGVLLTTHPLLVPRSWKSRAIPLLTVWDKPGL